MLPRSQRSILGEEGSDAVHRGGADRGKMSTNRGARRHGHGGRGHRRDAGDAVVGLRILVTHQHRHHARVVMKQMVLARHRHVPCSSFLRACSRCRRELSPNKDVYMYRGDQGFCSQECRWQQTLIDEAREREATLKKERRGMSLHHHHGPQSMAAIGGAPRRLLAVA
uniref:Uncharacterized protein n=1 Tax=Arundo donax TaxID=35708 RepID=A0A0A9SUT9_ARUDO